MKYLFSLVFFTLLILGSTNSVSAVHTNNPNDHQGGSGIGGSGTGSGVNNGGLTIDNPIAADNIQELFEAIIDIVLVFAVPIIVFFIIYAGFLYVTARGNQATIQKAHMALLYALIGGLLILGARVLIEVVGGTVDSIR